MNFIKTIAIFSLAILYQYSWAQQKQDTMTVNQYEKAWQEVNDFESKGLPESALKTTLTIYQQAKTESNAAQLVKAVIHILKFTDHKEDNAFVKNLNLLRDELQIAEFPAKPILHSMLAEMYWQYYQNNRYRFSERTALINVKEDDIETWSLNKIVEETFLQYKLSLEDADRLKATNIELYEEVLSRGDELGRSYRPTLFDFLAHRALDFATGEEPSITKPAYEFVIDKEDYLAEVASFVTLPVTSKDTFSIKYFAVHLFQEVLQFHLNDKDPEALVDADIKRIQFIKLNLVHPNKEALYLKTLEALEKKYINYPVSTRLTYLIAQKYYESATLYKPLQSADHQWDYKKAFDICETAKKRFPDADGAIQCENMQHDILRKSITATIEENNIPNESFRSLIRYQNFTDLHYRIIKTTREEVLAQRKKWENDYRVDRDQKFIEYFAAKTPLKAGKHILPDEHDYQPHSIEVRLDAMPPGEYMVLMSHHPDFVTDKNGLAYAFTRITNISYLHRSLSDGTSEFYVLHRKSGEPLAGAAAEAFSNHYNYKKQVYESVKIGAFVSDAYGYFKIPYVKNDRHDSFSVHFSLKEDQFSTEPLSIDGYHGGTIYQHPKEKRQRQHRTFFFLDRSIYRPGQTIYFKGLLVETDGKTSKIRANVKTTVSLYDVNYQIRAQVNVTSNEYGTFSGSFSAPTSGITGQMTLRSTYESGEAYFSVEEYKRPKFEVNFQTLTGTFRLNDTISTEGFARAYSGANIDGASVRYRVVRTVRFPFWWSCRWGWSGLATTPEMEITNGTTETDGDGKFTIHFQAIPDLSADPASDPTFDYVVYADVTDINGETHSSAKTVSVGYKALQVGVYIGNINKDQLSKTAKEFSIITTNLEGSFEPAKGNIKIYALKLPEKAFRARQWEQPDRKLYSREQYAQYFPDDLYEDENNKFKWELAKEVYNLNFDTKEAKTFTLDDLDQWKSGEYMLEIKAFDPQGKEVKEVTYFTVFSPNEKIIPIPQIHYFKPVKTNVEPGEKAMFAAGTSDKKIKVLYEIERDGELLSQAWITLAKEQRQFEIPVAEADRGGLTVHYTFIKNNRFYKERQIISVPFSNKELNISFETFRDKLQPGQQEQWKILVKGKAAEKMAAEMVATLYDESLDEFRSHAWYAQFFESNYPQLDWNSRNGFTTQTFLQYDRYWNADYERNPDQAYFDELNWFNYSFYRYYYNSRFSAGKASLSDAKKSMIDETAAAPALSEIVVSSPAPEADKNSQNFDDLNPLPSEKQTPLATQDFSQVKVRTNFNETAFFYPHLQTNANGEIIINFTIPEALTRWKMLGFAHTSDLQSGSIINHLVTQKELMVVPNQPRFFRENDKMIFQIKVSSLVEAELSGQAQLEFFDALTMKSVDDLMKHTVKTKPFILKSRQSTNLEWTIEIPEGLQAITYRVVAKAGDFSDGEEMTIPVVTNRMMVTESLPLPIRGKETKTFKFEKLMDNKSTTLRHHRFTLEFTSNPAWYAIQALPYLMEYPYDCVEQTFSKFYANSIATHIANANPRIKQVFDTWKNIQPDALLSNLEKNQELKSALLEETPWVLHAKDESQRKRNVGLLFDLNKMANEQERSLDKILKAQQSSGGFSWFPGFPENRYMTQHIISGVGHLDALGVKSVREDKRTWEMVTKAIAYLDRQIEDDYDQLKALAKKKTINLNDKHIGYTQIQYLYTRSYFKDIEINSSLKEAFDYYLGQAKKYWFINNIYLEGMTCLALHRFDDKTTTIAMMKSFSERALRSEEMGMYWKSNRGYYWYEAPIETQALMIEVYDEVAKDLKSVEALKVWLLKQKQTQDWRTTKATTEACYALLRRGTDALASTQLVDIKVGSEVVDPLKREDTKVEAGTGYFKTAWQAGEVKSDMGKITISKTDEGVAWGAAYWQYFEQLDKIKSAETPLKLKKELFKKQATERGPVLTPITEQSPLQIGDLVKVRIELRVDREMEYIHLKDMRAAGFEPTSTLSTHRYQDGLYYYESTRDLSTNFFIAYLNKGTYVFEYELRVSQKGDFSNGITNIQCMYAPEFTSHSEGIRVIIK
jgi:uncharacterized protein YfaS (alpha-2-macroglobulin family)